MINDPALALALNDLLCRVEPECAMLKMQVVDRPFEQAEIFPDGRLLVNIGLLLATRNEAEIAFVLAHESAHRRLRHRVAISVEARTGLELQADADAVRALRESDLPANAGLHLLERLLKQARETHMRRESSPQPALAKERRRVAQREEALSQIVARVDALRALVTRSNSARLPVTDNWQRLLSPYRLKVDAPASLPSQSPPNDP
ncbi:MAG: M48 family metalloprotease [Pseudomarimonas sp.]